MLRAKEAMERLRSGNRRFVEGTHSHETRPSKERRIELAEGQEPFAVILGCSDSRVPAELVFDQGLGDLFVIRIAGNIVAPSQIGSIEFAVEKFGTPVVVVLGHTRCGAVTATLDELEQPPEKQSPNLRSIVSRIRPAVQPLLSTNLRGDRQALLNKAIRANVRISANQLRHSSQIIEHLVQQGKLLIVGALYCLDTGAVEFFDEG